jgi:hypothetical protein
MFNRYRGSLHWVGHSVIHTLVIKKKGKKVKKKTILDARQYKTSYCPIGDVNIEIFEL